MEKLKRDSEMKAFIFARSRDALSFYLDNRYTCRYDEKKDPQVICTSNPRVAGLLRRYATPIPFPEKT